MDSIRVTAKTVEDAVLEASIQLGTSSDNLEYTVIEQGSKGFFGIGGKKAVIEAKKKFTDDDLLKEVFGEKDEKPRKDFKKEPQKEVKKESKKETRPEVKKEFKSEVKSANSEKSKEPRKEAKARPEKKAEEPAKEIQMETAEEMKPESSKEVKKEFSREPRKEYSRGQRRDRSRDSRSENRREYHKEPAETVSEAAVAEEEASAPKTPRVPADPEEAKRRANQFLTEIFRVMEMDVEIKTEFAEDELSVELSGDDMGLLIGKRGQTLDSLQYLTSLVVNKGKASYVRVKLDTEDYRNRRKATLENLAKNIAFKVKKTRRPVFLEPMNPYERRIIHSALQNDPYVTTHSEGDEPNRKVVVTPKKRQDGPYRGRGERTNRSGRYERAERSGQNERVENEE